MSIFYPINRSFMSNQDTERLQFVSHLTNIIKHVERTVSFCWCKCLTSWKQEVISSRLLWLNWSCRLIRSDDDVSEEAPDVRVTRQSEMCAGSETRPCLLCMCMLKWRWGGRRGGEGERLYDDPAFNTVCWACVWPHSSSWHPVLFLPCDSPEGKKPQKTTTTKTARTEELEGEAGVQMCSKKKRKIHKWEVGKK